MQWWIWRGVVWVPWNPTFARAHNVNYLLCSSDKLKQDTEATVCCMLELWKQCIIKYLLQVKDTAL